MVKGELNATQFLKKSMVSGIMQSISVVLTIGGSFVIAKLLGADGFGIYSYIFSWVMVLSVICIYGTDDLAIRETGKFIESNRKELHWNFLRWTLRKTGTIVIAMSILLYLGLILFKNLIPYQYYFPALLALPSLLFISMHKLSESFLLGQKEIVHGQWPEKIIKPGIFLLMILVMFIAGASLNVSKVVLFNSTSFFVAMICSVFLLLKSKIRDVESSPSAKSSWSRSATYFLMLNIVSVINSRADILMIGFFRPSEDIGAYALAARLCDFIPFALVVINPVTAPYYASYFKSANKKAAQLLFNRSARITFIIASAIFLCLYFSGKYILSYFGAAFILAYTPMLILGGGQLFNAFAGSVGNILKMAGFEKSAFISQGIAVGCNIVLNLLLIPKYGMNGAAIATAFALFL